MKLYILFVILFFSVNPNPWTFEKETDGIRAYSRLKHPHSYYEFKTKITLPNTTIENVVEVINDVASFKDWMVNTEESKILEVISENEAIGYTVSTTPWPLSSRDLVFRITKKNNSATSYSIFLQGMEDHIPEKGSYVRLKSYEASWEIEKTNTAVTVAHIASFDPDSSTPAWAIKNSMLSARIEVMQALRNRVNR